MADSSKKPKYKPWGNLFKKYENKLLLIMFAVIFFWIFFFIPDTVIVWIASRIGVANNIGGTIFTTITSGIIVLTFGRFMIGDPLLDGKSKSSLYFRGEYPSTKIAEKFNIDPSYSTKIFLSYYDCWQFDSEPQHELYLETTFVHYRCLFVYLLKPMSYVLSFFAVLILLLSMIYLDTPLPTVIGQGMILFAFIVLIIVLVSFNRLPSKRHPYPTGCWAAWRRRCEENYMEFLVDCGSKELSGFHNEIRLKFQDLKKKAQS